MDCQFWNGEQSVEKMTWMSGSFGSAGSAAGAAAACAAGGAGGAAAAAGCAGGAACAGAACGASDENPKFCAEYEAAMGVGVAGNTKHGSSQI